MIIILSSAATKENLTHVTQMLEERGYGVHLSEGVETTICRRSRRFPPTPP